MHLSKASHHEPRTPKLKEYSDRHMSAHMPTRSLLQQAVAKGNRENTPPPKQTNDEIDILLHGMIPYIGTSYRTNCRLGKS